MAVEIFALSQEYIHLNQLMKVLGWVNTGGEANVMIDEGLVTVNGNVELRRRNKIYTGFEVSFSTVVVE
jgi:ribosome-associated protein